VVGGGGGVGARVDDGQQRGVVERAAGNGDPAEHGGLPGGGVEEQVALGGDEGAMHHGLRGGAEDSGVVGCAAGPAEIAGVQRGLALHGVVDRAGPEALLGGGDDADRARALGAVEQLLNLAGADQLVGGPAEVVLVDPLERAREREPWVVGELGHDPAGATRASSSSRRRRMNSCAIRR
jgi:hypothetical protein